MSDEKEIKTAQKILEEDLGKESLYPMKSIIAEEMKDNIKKIVQFETAEKILGKIIDKNDLARKFIDVMPLYYDEAQNWWRWDLIDFYWRITDETDILLFIDNACDTNVIGSKDRTELLNALKLRARARKPKEITKTMIQFGKEIVDVQTGDRFPASHKYFVTNPVPFKIGTSPDTSKFDKLFGSWVNEKDVPCLYEIVAYCLLPDYPIERMFALLGSGSNGKSTYLKILYTFLGMKNICTTNLELLTRSRFETARLFKKLACVMGETNLAQLNESQLIKRLTSGKDPIPVEFKNKGLMDFISYAKLIIATNNLPQTDDKTDGFYRRWRIIDFPNQFEKEIDVLGDLTTEDFENLAAKCLITLCDVMKNRGFTGDGTIADRRKRYEDKSNPFDKFWDEFISIENPDSDIPIWEFRDEVNNYMKANHARTVSDKEISRLMKEKGIQPGVKKLNWTESTDGKSKAFRIWMGLSWRK